MHVRQSWSSPIVAVVAAGLFLASCSGSSAGTAGATPGDGVGPPSPTAASGEAGPASTGVASDVTPDDHPDVTTAPPDDQFDTTTEPPEADPTLLAEGAPTMRPEDVRTDGSGEGVAVDLIEPALEVGAAVLVEPASLDEKRLATVAEGAALGAMEASAAEFADNGWSQSGTPEVVDAEIVSLDDEADPPEVVVSACVDSTSVDILDESGESMVDPEANQRALNTLVLHFVDDRWVLVDRSFPDDPSC